MKPFGLMVAASVLAASAGHGEAADAATGSWAVGAGAVSCAKFAQDYAQNVSVELGYFSWAQGFMSGLNTSLAIDQKPLHDLAAVPLDTQERLVREYCSQHPLADYMEAVTVVFSTLPTMPSSK